MSTEYGVVLLMTIGLKYNTQTHCLVLHVISLATTLLKILLC